MDLNAVRMFICVVQAGSLTSAAQRLGMSLPTLSRRIRELESQLSIQLLERTATGVRLTDAGNRLFEATQRGVESLLEAEQTLISEQAHLKGRLRLSLPTTFVPWWGLLSEFQRKYPDIELHVTSTERRLDLTEDGIDVALRVGAVVHDNMVAKRMLSYRHLLVASPDFVRHYGSPSHPAELSNFPCAAWSARIDQRPAWSLGEEVVFPRTVMSVNDYRHLLDCALEGSVITELPPFLAQEAIRNQRLIPLLRAWPFPDVDISLIYPAHRHPSSLVRAYLAFCSEHSAHITEACSL
ncbi:LysR family transcriptional regulator [Pantoea sp. M_9]|uniref:LysR family transcriptional regulator n=1 Tax=Pantoea sp. M_9 TaxID=2608041 RepID=UPI0012328686|nr:LysR family transcriptional regulator [Pantoea sp. M_9]KAA5971392.1 LysR family transcriptional regulator [Pantoea sp. M_9]